MFDKIDASLYAETFKDAYGYRPQSVPVFATREEYQAEVDAMGEIIMRDENARVARENDSYDAWLINVNKLAAETNNPVSKVILWLIEADDATMGGSLDVGYYCYLNDLPYSREKDIITLLGR